VAAGGAILLLAAAHAAAQTPPAAPPGSGAPAQPAVPDVAEPLDPLPDIGVDWPTIAPEPAGSPDAASATARPDPRAITDAAAERRYRWRLDGVDGIGSALFRRRFAELSSLDRGDGDLANAAQLDRRAREDAELVATLLRAEGYYDAAVTSAIEVPESAGAEPLVVLTAVPGALYRFAEVTLAGVEAAGAKADALRTAFGLRAGDPVSADAVASGEAALRTATGREGFPFARVGQSELVVDRAARTASLSVALDTGTARRFGRIVALPGNRVFAPDHVGDIARFAPGDAYDAVLLDDLRRALIQTGLVASVELTPVEASTPGTVDLGVRLDPAPPRTVAGELGYGTGEGARAELSWTHRNLFPPEGALTLRGVLGTREQLGSVVFRRSNVGARDRVFTAQAALAHLERDAYQADTFLLSGAIERQSTIFFQKRWTWSAGAELVASDERDVDASTGTPRRRTYFIGALPLGLGYDGSDDLLNPTRGVRVGARVSPELSFRGTGSGYARTQFDLSGYLPVAGGVTIAARSRVGAILGATREAIAPSRRFYAGGGASVRGYGFQAIGPRDPNNDPIGGRSLAEVAVEARVPLFGAFGLVPFLDAGNIYTTALPDFGGFRYGAGLGVRYYSSFGPIRVDLGTPLNPRPGDGRVAVYVSLGQAF